MRHEGGHSFWTVTESPCLHLDQVCPWIRQPISHTGAKCPKAPFWTWPRPNLRKLVANLPVCLEPEPDKRKPSVQPAKFERYKVYDRELALGNRRNTSFATSHLQRKPSAPLVSDLKRAVPTWKRLRHQPETGVRFGPGPTQLCVLVYPHSALHNVDANPDEEGSDDEWPKAKQKGYSCPFSALCVGRCGGSARFEEKAIGSTTGAEASTCRDALDRAECCQVVIGGEELADEWKESTSTDCKSLSNCLAKDASVLEDRRMAYTVGSLRERCSVGVGRLSEANET